MIDKLSEKNIWVKSSAQNDGNGSFDFPYSKIQTAVNEAAPGSTIVLFPGIYEEKLTVRELCGTIENPITITAFNQDGEDVISHSEWYFYSAKDFVVKGITFRKTINSAISVVGESHRNCIKDCIFDECGELSECAVFFGGSGGENNIVENCEFSAPKNCKNHIAVMISQNIDIEDDSVLNSKNASVRFCDFINCVTGIVAGSEDNVSGMFGGHEICENLFENCENAVKIKISGTQISNNIFRSNKIAIDNACGFENEIFGNRFENCREAIAVCREDITIRENMFFDSKISIKNKSSENPVPILICENTFFSTEDTAQVIASEENIPIFITKNIFYNCEIGENKNFTIKDNLGKNIDFFDITGGDFSTDTGYGCTGGAQKRTKIEEIPQIDIVEMFREHEHKERFAGKMIEERDLLMKSMLFQDENAQEDEMEFEAAQVGQQPLRPIGIDGELEDN